MLPLTGFSFFAAFRGVAEFESQDPENFFRHGVGNVETKGSHAREFQKTQRFTAELETGDVNVGIRRDAITGGRGQHICPLALLPDIRERCAPRPLA